MKKVILFTILTTISSSLSGQDLYTEIANSEDHTTFLDLLEFTDLDELLINDDYYSVFAPSNEAFESKYDSVALDSLKINDPAFLEALLLNHFVADTVAVEFITGHYLPLSGSHFFLFVDAAGNVLLKSLGAPFGEPNIYLSGVYNSDELYTDFDNGRLFGLEQSIVHPNCQSTSEWDDVVIGPMLNILIQADWIDTLINITSPVTFLCPTSNDIYDYIDQNGGISNASFIDSLIRRHIIDEYLPLQDVESITIVQNLLGEDLIFSKENKQYFLDDSNEVTSFYDFKKSASFVMESFLVEPIVSTTEQVDLENFKVFPNPASGVVTVTNSDTSNRSIVTIYTIDGKFIHEGEYFGSQFDINISNLKSGLYLLEYRNKFNLKRTKLLVL